MAIKLEPLCSGRDSRKVYILKINETVFLCRLTKERDLARTELEVRKHDLDKLETDLKVIASENDRLKSEQNSVTNGLEKGSKEILESKENEIQKLGERVKSLEAEVQMLKEDKSALEKQKNDLEKALQNGDSKHDNVDGAAVAENQKKIIDLTEQIKIYKSELADKQKEFQHEKQELQKVIEELRVAKGGGDLPPDVEALNKELSKAQKEVKEAAVERERFQSQLEMLVQELEQKQVSFQSITKSYKKSLQFPCVC